MKQNKDSFNKASTLIALTVILSSVVYAWTGPSGTPPNNNVATPLNVGMNYQEKSGSLRLYGGFHTALEAYFDSNVGIGTVVPTEKLDVVGNGNFSGKVYSASTVDADETNTVVTKDYLDSRINNVIININTMDLYAGQHSSSQCTGLGGVVLTIPYNSTSTKICQFTKASLPTGWAQYSNYSQTSANTCNLTVSGYEGCSGTFTTGSHTWQNKARETAGPLSCVSGTLGSLVFSNKWCYASYTKRGAY